MKEDDKPQPSTQTGQPKTSRLEYRLEARYDFGGADKTESGGESRDLIDWAVTLPTLCGLGLGAIIDLFWMSHVLGTWTLLLTLAGLVLGEAFSTVRGGSVYKE